MNFLLIQNETDYPYRDLSSVNFKSYSSEGRAQAVATRWNKKNNGKTWRVMSYDAWQDQFNPIVTKRNLMSGKPFQGRKYEPACTDPSTETYWSM